MSACTIFKNFAVPVEDKSLVIISNWIASDKYKSEVEEIRLQQRYDNLFEDCLKKGF